MLTEGPGQTRNTFSVNILPPVPKISKAVSRITFGGKKKKGHQVGFKAIKRQRITDCFSTTGALA